MRGKVSTHSRPKAAGGSAFHDYILLPVSTHSRPKAAGFVNCCHSDLKSVSTHSRPKAAGFEGSIMNRQQIVSTHSRPKAAGQANIAEGIWVKFQLTAARRRLADLKPAKPTLLYRFNSQPPEGGWCCTDTRPKPASRFNSQPPEGGW